MRAWLLNASMQGDSAMLFFKTESGDTIKVSDTYKPYFYMSCPELEKAKDMMLSHPNVLDAVIEYKIPDIRKMEKEPVMRIVVDSIRNFRGVIKDSYKIPFPMENFETLMPHYFRYLMDKGICVFSEYEIETSGDRLISISGREPTNMPGLKHSALLMQKGALRLKTSNGKSFQIYHSGRLFEVIEKEAIDIVFSYMGDNFMKRFRDANMSITPIGVFFKGCIHIDIKKDIRSDIYADEYRIEPDERLLDTILEIGRERIPRMIELSSITNTKPDMVSRVTPGKLNTFLHIKAARKAGYIIPDSKKLIERPKSLHILNIMDRGGMIFYPEPGVHRNVAKCDFSSMYPSIIVKYNISPETMDCGCCQEGIKVPETGWRICSKKTGIIPTGLKPVLERRLYLKRMMKEEEDPEKKRFLDLRQKSLKNILVTCFGYLGFSNFIFSNVECKEAVMLFGRHILMETKAIAEEMGLEVVYGIVDSVFVRNGSSKKYSEFRVRVSEQTKIELDLDCIFDAIAFPASDGYAGVANKYYGITVKGELECRGIHIRHSDAPEMLKDFQKKAITILLSGNDMKANIIKLESLKKTYKSLILNNGLLPESFAITKRLRRDPEAYKVDAPHVIAWRRLNMVKPQKSRNIVFAYSRAGPVPFCQLNAGDIDSGKYVEMLERSYEELIRGI